MDENTAALEANTCHKVKPHFGDFNFPQDRFLKEQIKLDESWVPLELMIKFNSIESAKKFVENPAQKYKHTDLLVLFEEDYFAIMIILPNNRQICKLTVPSLCP
ncbi:hypothetical protein QTO34_007948 [Cnephaeus nilssonii]|uniref:HTH La-type RNA-binding domain-containing protein n=1 Tax=Cnephaeus nilssonii TaxID=3371016 RepID=A0AA40I9S3_CNENI|nr:hypothetical protein QTO34_007948 [Eptesicus nilssonii]